MSGRRADFSGARFRASPNCGPRRGSERPDLILLHYTGMISGEAAEAWLCDAASQVSSHYIVYDDGGIVQMVREADRAWHAGKSYWAGVSDINSCSVGIEIVNPGPEGGYPDFPEKQIEAVIALCQDIAARHAIRPERILAHSDVAPGRKIDPGEKFPWQRLAAAGVGHLVPATDIGDDVGLDLGDRGPAVEALQSALAAYGYGIAVTGLFDSATSAVVTAFQMHFRQARVDGRGDFSTVETLRRLLDQLNPAIS
jgi:N-acetylmuramoyl-L-alanine amidase